MEYLYLKPIHQRIIELLVMGHSHKYIAKKINITLDSLYS
jgi:UDP-2,3-diacylglucosamine pyrophosphatase LpxH